MIAPDSIVIDLGRQWFRYVDRAQLPKGSEPKGVVHVNAGETDAQGARVRTSGALVQLPTGAYELRRRPSDTQPLGPVLALPQAEVAALVATYEMQSKLENRKKPVKSHVRPAPAAAADDQAGPGAPTGPTGLRGRGGPGRLQGRKSKDAMVNVKRVTITIDDLCDMLAKQCGRGDRSLGVRNAVRFAQHEDLVRQTLKAMHLAVQAQQTLDTGRGTFRSPEEVRELQRQALEEAWDLDRKIGFLKAKGPGTY